MKLHELIEGRHDPHRKKAIFMMGAPGSGKSTIAKRLTGGTGLKLVNPDTVYEWLTIRGDSPIVSRGFDDELYRHSGRLMAKRMDIWKREGLGLLIDVTGRNVQIMLSLKRDLESIGYDTMAIFVNADLVTALNRNDARRRRVDPQWVRMAHEKVQRNLGTIQSAFRGDLVIVDNSEGADLDAIVPHRLVRSFLSRPNRPLRESQDDEYEVWLPKIIDVLRKHARPFLQTYALQHPNRPFYRGILRVPGTATKFGNFGFTAPVRQHRQPIHSPIKLHRLFNSMIKDAGGVANRSNAVSATGGTTSLYGDRYVYIPLGEFRYTWAHRWGDWFTAAATDGVDFDPRQPEPTPEQIQAFREKGAQIIRTDTGLEEANKLEVEVMFHSKRSLYLRPNVWEDLMDYHKDDLQ